MFPAASRFALIAVLAVSGGVSACAQVDNPRAAPSRPGTSATKAPAVRPVATKKFAGIDYVNIADAASRLGFKLIWVERGKKVKLAGSGAHAELEAGTRDITVNGLRVFLGDTTVGSGRTVYVSKIDFERCLAPLLRPGYGATPPSRPDIIVLDPGHGGRDTGTSLLEKVYALDVAKRTKKILEAEGFNVAMTREEDVTVELGDRPAFANARKADLFVSIHFNALENNATVSGAEVYTFPPANQHGAEWWSSMKKDDAYFKTEPEPVNRHDHWSVVLAGAIHRHFIQDLKLFDRGKKLKPLGALRSLNCPGVLVECGFLTHEGEAKKIATPEYRQKLAVSIADGIRDYCVTLQKVRGG